MQSGDILGGIASSTNTVTGLVQGLSSNITKKDGSKATLKDIKNVDFKVNNNFYTNAGVNLGFNKSSSNSNSHSESGVVTTIRGKDKNSSITYNNVKNIEYVGTQAQNTKFIYNNVENINKTAVELNNYSSSSSRSSGISAGVTIGYGDGTQTSVDAVKVSASKSKMNTNGTNFQNGKFVNVDEVHNNTKNMTLSGFNQVGGKVTGNIQNLTIESKQNTSTTTGSTKGGSLSIAPNGMPSGSANYSQTNGERKVVDSPTTFLIGDGSNLKVGKVENTAGAIGATGSGKLSIDEYIGHNLENKDETKTKGGSLSLSPNSNVISGVGVNYANRDLESVTKNTVIGNVEIGKSSGDEINKDLGSMTEITKDRDFKTDINIESQTINYIKNPEKFKEDLEKAKSEINDIYHAAESTIKPKGKETRSPIEQLGEVRQAKVILNVIGSRLDIAENQDDIAKAFEGVSEDLGYKVKVIYTNPSNSSQLIGVDKNGNKYIKDGTAYVDKDTGIGYILVNTESPANSTKAGVIGTIAEEQSHIIGKKEGRQKVVPDGSEKGLESLGRPTNDYFKKQYSKNDKAIELKSDGKDYSNVDFGENVGDKTIENPLELYDKKYTTADERKEVEKILSEEKGEDYLVDWELYNESLERDYRAEINYFVSQAKNRVNKLSEIEKGNFKEVPPKESVFHNFINTKKGKKIVINKSLRNTKKVDYDTGKEVVISKSNKIVKDYMNQGTSNNFTYGPDGIVRSDEGKFDKMLHGIFDIGNYISKGTGVADKTTTLERINMTILGTLVSLNYDELEKWASENNYNAIGYKEYFEYKIYKFYINSYKNSRRNMYK